MEGLQGMSGLHGEVLHSLGETLGAAMEAQKNQRGVLGPSLCALTQVQPQRSMSVYEASRHTLQNPRLTLPRPPAPPANFPRRAPPSRGGLSGDKFMNRRGLDQDDQTLPVVPDRYLLLQFD